MILLGSHTGRAVLQTSRDELRFLLKLTVYWAGKAMQTTNSVNKTPLSLYPPVCLSLYLGTCIRADDGLKSWHFSAKWWDTMRWYTMHLTFLPVGRHVCCICGPQLFSYHQNQHIARGTRMKGLVAIIVLVSTMVQIAGPKAYRWQLTSFPLVTTVWSIMTTGCAFRKEVHGSD